MEGLNEIEVTREDNQSDVGVLQVFWIYGCWSVEEMKIFALFSCCQWRCRGLAFRNTSGWLVVSGIARQFCRETVVLQDCQKCRIGVWKTWPVAGENGELADVAY